jgi:hypothetical protein
MACLGLPARTIRAMAARGEIPGAAKFGAIWTFSIVKLDEYVSQKEREAWQNSARHRQVVSGGTASSMGGYKPAAKTSNGRYELTIQKLRQVAVRRSEIA